MFRVGTWVAECTLFKKIGGVLKCFRAQEHLTKKLHRTRALMKMYADATPHARGPNARRYKKAEQAMISAGAEIDMLAEKVIKYRGIMAKEPDEVDEEGGMGPQRKSINDSINAPACAAFVVFEYSESMARCVGDYQAVSSFPRSLFYPKVRAGPTLLHISRVHSPVYLSRVHFPDHILPPQSQTHVHVHVHAHGPSASHQVPWHHIRYSIFDIRYLLMVNAIHRS